MNHGYGVWLAVAVLSAMLIKLLVDMVREAGLWALALFIALLGVTLALVTF